MVTGENSEVRVFSGKGKLYQNLKEAQNILTIIAHGAKVCALFQVVLYL